jgi:hypothetical protein
MKAKWVVVLDITPKMNDFRSGFFPRKFWYKRDAMELVAEVQKKGGQAHVEPYHG